jgi:hypothetical protein
MAQPQKSYPNSLQYGDDIGSRIEIISQLQKILILGLARDVSNQVEQGIDSLAAREEHQIAVVISEVRFYLEVGVFWDL